ncbi:MAG: hypothetical protein H0U71_01530 [Gammaproteobacteria bacterium]|nr:hypothetical protein [Gammaproteobacteria bacterium]
MKLTSRGIALFALSLYVFSAEAIAEAECSSGGGCAACGEFITNLPMPSADNCGVQPLQNYVATYENCLRSGWNGIYLGTGFGYGTTNYNLKIPGIILQKKSNSYITEYVSLGYAHSSSRFFIAGELGYYYQSLTSPLFYDDPSVVVFTTTGPPEVTNTITPCHVRLDINSQNHFALDLMPGFVATSRITIFSRLGFEYTNYSWVRRFCFPEALIITDAGVPIDIIGGDIFPEDLDSYSIGDKKGDSVVDLRLGAGISFAAGPHLSFNVNYVHIFGSKASFTPNAELITDNVPVVLDEATGLPIPGTLTSGLSTLLAQNSIDPSRNEILFGATFSF